MRILAIEVSSSSGSIAILENQNLIDQVDVPADQGSARALIPAIGALLDSSDWKAPTIDLIALTTGPGSFTNLRISVTAAKLLAYAGNSEIVGVNTLQVIAHRIHQADLDQNTVVAVIDAQRKELFSGQFKLSDVSSNCETTEDSATQISDRSSWMELLPESCVVTGTGLNKMLSALKSERPDVVVADQRFWRPLASDVGLLGWQRKQANQIETIWNLVPNYYRKSAAEEKLQAESLDRE